MFTRDSALFAVAPHAGAWIETLRYFVYKQDRHVAPHAGAWIETECVESIIEQAVKSHPMRVRGLKPHIE